MDKLANNALGGIGKGIINYLNGLEEDKREQMRAESAMRFETARQNFLMNKQMEHDTALERIRGEAIANSLLEKQRNREDLEKRREKTSEMQIERNANLVATRQAQRLSGSSGNPIIDKFLNIPPTDPETYGFVYSNIKLKELIDSGFEKKAFEIIKNSIPDETAAKKRLLALKSTPSEEFYSAIARVRPSLGTEQVRELKKMGKNFRAADFYKEIENKVSKEAIPKYNIPENPKILPSGGLDSSDQEGLDSIYGDGN